jgi:hypothetical protein
MLRTDQVSPIASRGVARAMDVWREAAELVSIRWQMFLEAEGEGRSWAFAAYVAALDAEEAAASAVAELAVPLAA